MLHIVLMYMFTAQAATTDPLARVPYDTFPPPGMYTIYKNGVGEPLYMYVPDQAQRDLGNRMKVFDYTAADKLRQQIGLPPNPPVIIPDRPVGADTQPQQAAPPIKGPTFLQRLGRGMQATGQSMMYGGSAGSVQALPLPSVTPMQFPQMQRPVQFVPSGRTILGPTYTQFP